MSKAQIKVPSEIEHFKKLRDTVEKLMAEKREQEEDLGDIPDEFLGVLYFPISFPNFVNSHSCIYVVTISRVGNA